MKGPRAYKVHVLQNGFEGFKQVASYMQMQTPKQARTAFVASCAYRAEPAISCHQCI